MKIFSLPDEVAVNITVDDITRRSFLTTNNTIRCIKKSFFYTKLSFNQSYSGVLGDIEGFVQLVPGSHNSDKPNKFTVVDKVHPKSDCINGSIVSRIRGPILYSFALTSPPCHEMHKKSKNELSEK